MSFKRTEVKRRVWIGLVVACAAVGGWVVWSRSRPVSAGDAFKVRQPFVQLAGVGTDVGDQLLREKAELMDPTPLFFPTEWNYGYQPLDESSLKHPGEFFGSFLPKPTIDEQKIASYGAEAPIVPEKLADVLVQGNEAPFAGIGQVDGRQASLPIRAGFLEVGDLKSGESIISQSLSGLLLPRTDFDPVEFIVVVGPGGLIGEPFLMSGSGWEEVDTFFRTYLVKSYRLGERLRPGRYRVVLGT